MQKNSAMFVIFIYLLKKAKKDSLLFVFLFIFQKYKYYQVRKIQILLTLSYLDVTAENHRTLACPHTWSWFPYLNEKDKLFA